MKVLNFIKSHRGMFIAGVAAVLIVAGLITAIAVLAKPEASDAVGTINPEELSGGVLRYSSETDAYFIKAFRTYYNRVFEDALKTFAIKQKASEVISPNAMANAILLAMRNGGVSADKVLALAYYLENVDSGDILEYILLSYLVPYTDENGNIVYYDEEHIYYTIGEKADLQVLYDNGVSITQAVDDILENTTITAEDIGNVCYHLMLNSAEGEYKEVLTKLDEDGFRALFVSGAEVYSLLSSLESGVSISETRLALELMYEVGEQYNKIVTELGTDGIKVLADGIGFGNGLELDNALVEGLDKIANVAPLLISFFGKALTGIDSGLATTIVAAVSDNNDEAYAFTAVKLAGTVTNALQEAEIATGTTEEDAIEYIACVLGTLDYIEGMTDEEDTDKAELDALIQDNRSFVRDDLELMKRLAEYDSGLCKDYESGCISAEKIAEIKETINGLELKSDSIVGGVNKLGSLTMYSMVLSLFVNLYEE